LSLTFATAALPLCQLAVEVIVRADSLVTKAQGNRPVGPNFDAGSFETNVLYCAERALNGLLTEIDAHDPLPLPTRSVEAASDRFFSTI
jgi:hypothetical protein